MAAGADEEHLVRALLAVLKDGGIERLDAIMAPDCEDLDPMAGQLPGRAGYAQKVLLFRALFPDARIELEELRIGPPGARATWTTEAQGIAEQTGHRALRFTGEFAIEGGRIRSTRIVERGPARP
jgi:hypothetical protein